MPLVLIAALLGLAPVSSSVATDTPAYLALGDSIAFGYNPTLDRTDPTKFVGYPDSLAQTLGLSLTNAACPGETSSHLVSLAGSDYRCQIFRANYPLHVSYTTSQLDFAVAYLLAHPETTLVTLDIGSNDLFLLQQQCGGSTACMAAGLSGLLSSYTTNLITIYGQLRISAHYSGAIVALTYYAPNYNDTAFAQAVSALDQVIGTETLATGGRVADGYAAFQNASAPAGGDPCTAGLLIPLTAEPLSCDVHPSPAGQRLLATTIAQAAGHWSIALPFVTAFP